MHDASKQRAAETSHSPIILAINADGKGFSLDGQQYSLDAELLNLDNFSQKLADKEVANAQLKAAMLKTGVMHSLVIWKEQGKLLDGFRRIAAYELLTNAEKKLVRIEPPTFVGAQTEADAAMIRFQVQDSHRPNWNGEARAIVILKNESLRTLVKKAAAERQLSGKKADDPNEAGDQWAILARKAGISRDKMYRFAYILENPNKEMAEKHVSQIMAGKKSVTACYKEARNVHETQAAAKAMKISLPKLSDIKAHTLDCIVHCNCMDGMERLSANTVDLTVTSPHYPQPQLYDAFDLVWKDYADWLDEMSAAFEEVYRVTKPGGHCCVNVANTFVKGGDKTDDLEGWVKYSCDTDLIDRMRSMGWIYCDKFVWAKQNSDGDKPKTGSHAKPMVNTAYEFIIVMRKPGERVSSGERTITNIQRYKWLMGGLWTVRPQAEKNGSCKYPFPEEIPHRLIEIYTNTGDVILDPYSGSGTTCAVAKKRNRHFIGFEKNEATALEAAARVERAKAGDAVAPHKDILHMLGAAAARKMLNCPTCSQKKWKVMRYKNGTQPTCPCCAGDVEVTNGETEIPFFDTELDLNNADDEAA